MTTWILPPAENLCTVSSSKRRKGFWVAQVYARNSDGVKTYMWYCEHQHPDRVSAVVCADRHHSAVHPAEPGRRNP